MMRKLAKWMTAKKRRIGNLCLAVLIIVLNVLAWVSSAFCDFYVNHIFPLWIHLYGRITGLFPLSVGELMIIVLLFYLGIGILLLPVRIFAGKKKAGRVARTFYSVGANLVLPVLLVMTLNCFLLYHVSKIPKTDVQDTQKLVRLYEDIVSRANELSEEVDAQKRNEELQTSLLNPEYREMCQYAVKAMQNIGDEFPRLKGYYPLTKTICNSWFLSQQYIAGYYFPFSMESNVNGMMYVMNYPYTICHELSHVHGYIYEDEANYLAYRACTASGDLFFEYSGYLGVLPYVVKEINLSIQAGEIDGTALTQPSDQVRADCVFLTDEMWKKVEEQSSLSTEKVSDITDTMLEANLQLNGVKAGIRSYNQVVLYLLNDMQ